LEIYHKQEGQTSYGNTRNIILISIVAGNDNILLSAPPSSGI